MDQVWMRSPTGDIQQVNATAGVLGPLMAQGWHQVKGPAALASPGSLLMQSPSGETQEVAVGSPAVSQLMAQGWHEVPPQKTSGSK
jgi:hypothetical protein